MGFDDNQSVVPQGCEDRQFPFVHRFTGNGRNVPCQAEGFTQPPKSFLIVVIHALCVRMEMDLVRLDWGRSKPKFDEFSYQVIQSGFNLNIEANDVPLQEVKQ